MTDFEIYDCHQHFGNLANSIPGLETGADEEFAKKESATRLSILESADITHAVIIGGHSYLRPDGIVDTRRINDGVVNYCERFPSKFPAAVGIVEPLYGDRGLEELDRCKIELGMIGISFHTRFQGVSLDSPWIRKYLERMGELELIPWVHSIAESSDEALWKVESLATDFPDLNFLVLDVFSSLENPRLALEVARRCSNTYFDTGMAIGFELALPLIRECGAGRILFGSDLYSWPLGKRAPGVLAEILESPLTPVEKAAILGGNLRSLLQ